MVCDRSDLARRTPLHRRTLTTAFSRSPVQAYCLLTVCCASLSDTSHSEPQHGSAQGPSNHVANMLHFLREGHYTMDTTHCVIAARRAGFTQAHAAFWQLPCLGEHQPSSVMRAEMRHKHLLPHGSSAPGTRPGTCGMGAIAASTSSCAVRGICALRVRTRTRPRWNP